MKIIAQVFGIGAMVALFLTYQQKKRERIIIAKLCADICWVLHYWCLGGIAGMIPNAVGIFRELVFINRKNKKWANVVVWPILFVLINCGLGFSTFCSAFDLLPIIASTFVTVSLWIDNPRLTKIISLPVSLAFIIYDFFIGSYVGIVNELIVIASIIIFLMKKGNLK